MIVGTDPDLAGQVAVERDFWLLTPHGIDPGYALLPNGLEPADLLAQRGAAALTTAVASGQPSFHALGEQLLSEQLDNLDPDQAQVAAMRVISARPSKLWTPEAAHVAQRLRVSEGAARRELRDAVKTWHADPRKAALAELRKVSDVRVRLASAANKSPVNRWAPLTRELDARLVEQCDWPATAATLQHAHERDHNFAAATRMIVPEGPLGGSPARDLRYRVVSRLHRNDNLLEEVNLSAG